MKKATFFLLLGALVILAGCNTQGTSGSGGGSAPDFSVTTVEGATVKLSDYKGEKPVMLYFFASWCPNCARDLSALQEVYPEYEDDVVMLAVDVDPQESPVQIGLYQDRYPGLAKALFAQANTVALSSYQVRYTTTKFAINREGNIIFSNAGSIGQAQWKALLEQLKNS